MAVKQVIVSDLSGKDIDPGHVARVVVSDHPALGGKTVELDADVSEVEKLQSSKLTMVSVAVHMPDESTPRRIILDAAAFDRLFKGDVTEVLQSARPGGQAPAPTRRPGRGRAGGVAPRPVVADKIDYTSHEHFGQLHRGRVTEEEAKLVRDNLEEANAHRERAGQKRIEPDDPVEKKRYGF